MRSKVKPIYDGLRTRVEAYCRNSPLPGLAGEENLNCFVLQLVDSIRRTEFVERIRDRDVSQQRTVPASGMYDPIRAAIYFLRERDIDNACWQIYLSTHFGYHKSDRWALPEAIYGSLGGNQRWEWQYIVGSFNEFVDWYEMNHAAVHGRFGNHRKYQSLKPEYLTSAFKSYIDWVLEFGTHRDLLAAAEVAASGVPEQMFDHLFRSMLSVRGFGRTACFDYLCMLKKTGVANISPGIPYMTGATGPQNGARILFGGSTLNPKELDRLVADFGKSIGVGMQEMEDSICNWQKSPSVYRYFGG